MFTTSGHRRIITPARHPFRFRVVGHAHNQKGYAPYPRSETPVPVTPRLHSVTAASYMALLLNYVERLRRGIDAVRVTQAFVREEIERTPDEDEHTSTYASGYSALTAIADAVASEAREVGDCVRAFLKESPDLEALMKADEALIWADAVPPVRGDVSQKAA